MDIIHVRIDDKLGKRFRVEVAKRYGGQRGALSRAIVEAIQSWLESEPIEP